MLSKTALCCCTLAAATQASACFTVLSANDRVVYHAADPPVDMSRQIHETLPRVFPGGHMVFDLGTNCPRAMPAQVVRDVSAPEHDAAAPVSAATLPADMGPRTIVSAR